MAEAKKLPFKGATHQLTSGEYVKATHWLKDGDHPKVERYPIERREFKGLLVVGPKVRYGLRFGDWIIEDAKGRLYVISGQPIEEVEMKDVGGGMFKQLKVKKKSLFEQVATALPGLLVAMALALVLPNDPSVPFVFFGVTHLMYYSSLLGQWNGLANSVFDLDTDTMKLAAATNTYAPNQDTHDFFDDVTNEVTGTNYTAGGATLGTPTVARSTGTVTFDGADIVWTQHAAGFSTGRKFVLYRSTGVASTSRLYSVITADGDVGNVTGDLTIAFNAAGIATWSTT